MTTAITPRPPTNGVLVSCCLCPPGRSMIPERLASATLSRIATPDINRHTPNRTADSKATSTIYRQGYSFDESHDHEFTRLRAKTKPLRALLAHPDGALAPRRSSQACLRITSITTAAEHRPTRAMPRSANAPGSGIYTCNYRVGSIVRENERWRGSEPVQILMLGAKKSPRPPHSLANLEAPPRPETGFAGRLSRQGTQPGRCQPCDHRFPHKRCWDH